VTEEFVDSDQADTRPAIDAPPTQHDESAASQAAPEPALEELPGETDTRVGAASRSLSFQFNLAKIEGQGEDSDPILRQGRELGLVAVFDGMGGAGGTVYETADGPRTGAYLASRAVRNAVERRMLDLLDPEWNLDGPATASDLQQTVKQVLTERLSDLNAPASGLRSRLLRALPTTMALIALQRREPGGDVWDCHMFWAGDSRAYVFLPTSGAHQLTLDDIRDGGDAMTNLREDSVISNAMSADVDFVVHHREVQLTAPFLVAAATDGCFGYVPTPMHFEYLVLATLRKSDDPRSWSVALQGSIAQVTGDDASMSLLGVGANHAQFKELFADRTAQLETTCITPLDELEAEVLSAERELHELSRRQQQERTLLWAKYRPAYEQYLPSKRDV
jgi:serine/threonine protein phosphatase PrpC